MGDQEIRITEREVELIAAKVAKAVVGEILTQVGLDMERLVILKHYTDGVLQGRQAVRSAVIGRVVEWAMQALVLGAAMLIVVQAKA